MFSKNKILPCTTALGDENSFILFSSENNVLKTEERFEEKVPVLTSLLSKYYENGRLLR